MQIEFNLVCEEFLDCTTVDLKWMLIPINENIVDLNIAGTSSSLSWAQIDATCDYQKNKIKEHLKLPENEDVIIIIKEVKVITLASKINVGDKFQAKHNPDFTFKVKQILEHLYDPGQELVLLSHQDELFYLSFSDIINLFVKIENN